MSPKKPLDVKTDAFVPGQRLLGYDVGLNNGYSDPSVVREALMTEVLRPFMPTQQTAHARVAVNGAYLDPSLAVEQVEDTLVDRWFPDGDGILIKGDPPAGPGMGAKTFHSSLKWESEDLARYSTLYEVKTDGAQEAGLTAIREATRVLDTPVSQGGTSGADLPAAAERIPEADLALSHLAANNLAANNLFADYDSCCFGHNSFWFLSERDGLLRMPIWDTSRSFGRLELGELDGAGAGTRVEPFALDDADERPVLRRLPAVPERRADFAAHYRSLLAAAPDHRRAHRGRARLGRVPASAAARPARAARRASAFAPGQNRPCARSERSAG